jgi:DNA-binding SARP family transcriptional activator
LAVLRLYLCGRTRIELAGRLLDEKAIGGPQARLVLAYLALARGAPVDSGALAQAIWGEDLPQSWELSLSAVVSNLRATLAGLELPRKSIERSSGYYALSLVPDAWVDWHAATTALDQTEGALRRGDAGVAWGWAGIVTAVHRRPFLAGLCGDWIEGRRSVQRTLLLRGLDCFVEICSAIGEPALALKAAEEAVEVEPFRETGHARLMRLHLEHGNRAEALRVYDRCRRLIAAELGVDPSPQLQELFAAALR